MKFSLSWLKKYINTNASVQEIESKLNLVGFEVDEVVESKLKDFVAGKIIESKPHPDSDHLHLLKVDDGSEILDVVCGAPNVRVGLVSVLAKVGVEIPTNKMIIKSGKIRGCISNGMMCSAKELGIGDDNSGIMELDSDIKPGTSLADIVNSDVLFVGEITPNRPDYLSVWGIATDLIACGLGTPTDEYKKVLNLKTNVGEFKKTDGKITIRNTIKELCPWYSGCLISNVKNNKSEKCIYDSLVSIEHNPKNALVDITNYICFDLAQPMHVFDADKISGDIVVRMAEDGEQLDALDGNVYTLSKVDLVIADDKGPMALAGIMGGIRTCSDENTKNVFVECAYFNPVNIRKTGRRLKIESDARYRYERGINYLNQVGVLEYARDLILKNCGGVANDIIADGIVIPMTVAKYNPDIFKKKIGIEIDKKEQLDILKKLNFEVDDSSNEWKIKVPGNKVDITMDMDIVEEILRIHGYDNLQGVIDCDFKSIRSDKQYGMVEKLKVLLAGRSCLEHRSFSFSNSEKEKMIIGVEPNFVLNPIVVDMDVLRQTLITNLLDAVQLNQQMGNNDLSLFEIGPVFLGKNVFDDKLSLSVVRSGLTESKHWLGRSRTFDVFDVKADIFAILKTLGFNPDALKISTENAPKWAHPYRFGHLMMGKILVATFGELHPMIVKKLKLKGPIVVGELNLYNLPKSKNVVKKSSLKLSDLQMIKRDFSFILNDDISSDDLVKCIYKIDNRIEDVNIFDYFKNEEIGSGKMSVALSILLQPIDVMTDEEINEFQSKVIDVVSKEFGGIIRDN